MASRGMTGEQRTWDVAVVGAGVLGTAIAARLSQTTASVILLEAAGDVAEHASKGNAGVAPSYYAGPGTLEASLTGATYQRWPEVCRKLDVTYRRLGGLIVAMDEEEAEGLPAIFEEARGVGAAAELIDGDAVRRLEPMVSGDAVAGLWLAEEGVIDPLRLTVAYAELAARNGAEIRFRSAVTSVERDGDCVAVLHTPSGPVSTRFVVNASGVRLGEVSALAGGETFRMWPRRGEYWLLDREFGSRLQRIVFAAPSKESKGIHVLPTTHGNALLGPSGEDIGAPDDKATHEDMLAHVFERAQRLVPSVSLDYAVKTFAANRPASEEKVILRFDGTVSNLLHIANRSSGVGSSLGTADHALGLLREAGLDAADRPGAADSLPAVPRLNGHPDPEALVAADPLYGQVVCVCEQVSAAEIAAALRSPVPARSLEGVRKRTRATGGRCQGAICAAGVAFMCSLRYGLPPEHVQATDLGLLGIEA
jgi:glycerol-3-phosphate dehydrogenase